MTPLKINRKEIRTLSTSGLIAYTNARIVNMTDNPYFLTPVPTTVAIKTLLTTFIDADALARQVRSTLNTQARKAAYNALIAGHIAWADYIEAVPGLTYDMLLTTGYTPYSKRTEAEIPTPASKPTYKIGVNTGEIMLLAKPYKQGSHRMFYNWKVSEDQGATWQNMTSVNTSHRRKESGLELGKVYWFKVAYATSAGEGEASPHISVVLTQDSRTSSNLKSKTMKADLKAAA